MSVNYTTVKPFEDITYHGRTYSSMYQDMWVKIESAPSNSFASTTVIFSKYLGGGQGFDYEVSFVPARGYYYRIVEQYADSYTDPRTDEVLDNRYACPDKPASPTNLSESETATKGTWELSWTNGGDGGGYVTVEISDSLGVYNQVIEKDASLPTSIEIPLKADTTYYWRVKHTNDMGDTTNSTPNIFTTGNNKPDIDELSLIAPTSASETDETLVTFVWKNGASADTKTVQVGQQEGVFDNASADSVAKFNKGLLGEEYDSGSVTTYDSGATYSKGDLVDDGVGGQVYASLVNDNTGNDPATSPSSWAEKENYFVYDSLTLPLSPDTTYFWRIKNSNYDGETTSETQWFTTPDVSPYKPSLYQPISESQGEEFSSLSLYWSSDTGYGNSSVEYMTLQIGQDKTVFDTVVEHLPVANFETETIESNEYYKFTTTLLPNTTYFWRVINHNSKGDYYSKTFWFKTRAKEPNRVSNTSYNNTTDVLSWDAPNDAKADYYDVYISQNYNDVVSADTDSDCYRGRQSGTSYDFSDDAAGNTLYYYRIDTIVDVDGATANEGVTKGKVLNFYTGNIGLATAVSTTNKEKLIAIVNDTVYYGDTDGENFTDSGVTIDTSVGYDTLCAFNKCFVVNGKTKKVIDFTNKKITLDDYTDGDKLPVRDTILYQDEGLTRNAAIIDYLERDDSDTTILYAYIQVINGSFTADSTDTYWINSEGNKITYTATAISDTPNIYDYAVYPSVIEGNKDNGEVPDKADIITLYQGSIVMADTNSNVFYISSPANPFKFTYYEENEGFASSVGYVGKLGQNITAIIPFRDDYLIISGKNEIWMYRGSPSTGARLDSISSGIGIFSSISWCQDGFGRLFFVDPAGLFMFDGGSLDNLTLEAAPQLENIFTVNSSRYITAVFNRRDNNIVFISAIWDDTSDDTEMLLYSLDTGGFFNFSTIGIASGVYDDDRLLLGCKDGAIKYFNYDSHSDSYGGGDIPINSSIQFGVFRLTKNEFYTSMLETLEIYCNKESSLILNVYTGLTADDVADKIDADNPDYSASISESRSRTFRPRLRGSYFSVKIENNNLDSAWAIERIAIKGKPFGKVRLV